LTDEQKTQILTAYKIDDFGQRMDDDQGHLIQDAMNTLYSISQYFIGDHSHIRDRNQDLLSNMRCKSLGRFREYKELFLQKVLCRPNYNQPFWKEKFLAGLPQIIGDQVRDKIREEYSGQIPYHILSYGEIVSYVYKQGTQMCNTIKLQKQLKEEQSLTNRSLGDFCAKYDPSYNEKTKPKCKGTCPSEKINKETSQQISISYE